MIKNALKLIGDIEKKKDNWDERSSFKIKSVGNLSVADLDTLKLYAQRYIQNASKGRPGFKGLMQPLGNIEKVLSKYGLEEEKSRSIW
jgi:hypothetical protein